MTEGPIPVNRRQIDYAHLYDQHEEYAARRIEGSFEQARVELEAKQFKIPNLVRLIPYGEPIRRVLEIGCATGELIGNFPMLEGGERFGCDISSNNIAVARARFPGVTFFAGDFADLHGQSFDCVILSDVLEHVEDDFTFLRDASRLARLTLINLPLEDNWLNRRRHYGPHDVSGHLRRYSLQQGLDLVRSADLKVLNYRQVWVHELSVDANRRALRKRFTGRPFAGSFGAQLAKAILLSMATAVTPVGRRLFASNLFALAAMERG